MQRLLQNQDLAPKLPAYMGRLNNVSNIKAIDLHIEEVAGEDKTVDVVVEVPEAASACASESSSCSMRSSAASSSSVRLPWSLSEQLLSKAITVAVARRRCKNITRASS